MIIFLYGEDTYRSSEKLNEIVENYKKTHKSGLNLKYLDFKDSENKDIFFDFFENNLFQNSIFKEKKLWVIINSFSNQKFKEKFLKESKKILESDDIFIFLEKEIPDSKNLLFKFLKKNAKCQEFKILENKELKKWIKKEFEKYNTKIEEKEIEKLIFYAGNDLWRLSNEIKKLANYKDIIKSEDIDLLIKPKIETNIFKTIDAISQKDKKTAIKLIYKHLENGDNPLYLFSMIEFGFRNLLIVKNLSEKYQNYSLIVKKSGLHPFVAQKSYFQAKKFSFEELKKIYQKLFQIDLDIKTGKIKPEAGLEMFLAEI
ncbi:MAG TPA: DNA polymerase III subunit delta [Candidatus Pacearchaeota archaeon]|nr:DNA polymerase III subunit delta [Candidatus Pacearchaeota archaeon]HPO68218.1 DNA polymerase III subunit delta [Candidatus Pacearchaeota archaeon]